MNGISTHKTSVPYVTIGVCVRNSATTIGKAIESIMDQDYPHELMEVTFVDDGSEDRTLLTIKAYAPKMDMQVKIYSHTWKGLGSSRNVVVNSANGDYIVWVDGDMVLPRDYVKKQVKFMEKNPNIGIAKAKYGIYPQNNLVGILEDIGYLVVDNKYRGEVDTSRALGTGGAIYRVKAIRDVGGFDEHISGVGEDLDIECRIRSAGWRLFRATPAVFYEVRRKTLQDLWKEGFWHGYGGHLIFRKNSRILSVWKMTPLAGLITGVWYSTIAYKIVLQKFVFLLPLQYTFKRIAWCCGFFKGQMDWRKIV